VADTIKRVGADGEVLATVDRSVLRAVQTPQGFHRATLEAAHAAAADDHTDDAAWSSGPAAGWTTVPATTWPSRSPVPSISSWPTRCWLRSDWPKMFVSISREVRHER